MRHGIGAIDKSLSGFRKDQSLRHRTGIVYPNQHVTADKEVTMCERRAKAKIVSVKDKYIKGKGRPIRRYEGRKRNRYISILFI
jgi:hypothetical protein